MSQQDKPKSPCNMTFTDILLEYLNYQNAKARGLGLFPSEVERAKELQQELDDRCPYRPID